MALSLFRKKKGKTGKTPVGETPPAETPAAGADSERPFDSGAAPEPPVEPDPDVAPGPDAGPRKRPGLFARFRTAPPPEQPTQPEPGAEAEPAAKPKKKPGMFARLKGALGRTRTGLVDNLSDFLRRRKSVDGDLIEEIETLLLTADVGIDATARITEDIGQRLKRRELKDPDAVFKALRENMLEILTPVGQPLAVPADREGPFVILVVGVNGTGKTTTIGKLAKRLEADGLRVMLAAGDTFRAAAVEQLQVWGERNDIPVIAQKTGADSASVIFDALQSAKARRFDVLIADTAGRLHTQVNLMEELKKVRRVMTKLDDSAPHETLLVLDAGTGQNALVQARQFHEALGLTGVALTKLDGTAKGGIILAIAQQLALPIRFIGVGEGIDDLRPFDAGEFVDALFA
uniref:Signal recognition particle receptor FtsY n=1 Tax=Candidatus Kentrum eta TaxID=2126337 RepID=A0A450U7I3_9GAMM|nr:MAG: fused signal recognition particle receptor [Candidatus Kentron sp. H]VFJ89502.1 MAG: fused signal recognition particle receptor [Candidatus Kentron sp. H]VFJ96154.1 MAG: fused signal recognition particle receptor [Candidatus Kentron sp. H]